MARRHESEDPLVAWALGEGPAPETLSSLERSRAAQYGRLASALRLGFINAPESVVIAAREIFPHTHRAMPRVTVLGMAGARGGLPDALQVRYEADPHAVRVSYERIGGGWLVLGEGPSGAWVETSSGDFESPDGRFEFACDSASETGFVIRLPDLEIEIPAATETPLEDGR